MDGSPTRRILRGPVLFVVLGTLLGLLLDRGVRAVAPPFPNESVRWRQLEQRAGEIRVLSAGNSHCLAIDFHALGLADRGYHVWHSGQDLFELQAQMETILPRLPAVDTVLLSVSYASFHRDNGAARVVDRGDVRRTFYSYPPPYPPIGGDLKNWLVGQFAALVREDHGLSLLGALVRAVRQPGAPLVVANNLDATGLIDQRRGDTEQPYEQLARTSREVTVPRHAMLQYDMMRHNPELPGAALESLRRTLALFRERGLRVVAFTAPVFIEYTRAHDPKTIQQMKALMAGLVEEFGIEYHDFSTAAPFAESAHLFANPDHLNARGSAAFSRRCLAPLVAR